MEHVYIKMENKKIFWIIGIIILIGILVFGNLGLFSVSGSERMSRSYTALVNPGDIVTVTYTATSTSGQFGASIIDTLICPGIANQEKRFVLISDEGTSKTVQYNLPNSENVSCKFYGNYIFGNKSLISFTNQTITTRITTISHNSKSCYDNDVYWYNSKNVLEDKFAECGVPGCANNVCRVQNTIADTDFSGTVDRTELGIFIANWISGSVTRENLGLVIQAWSAQ
jgi:hypothetical protein